MSNALDVGTLSTPPSRLSASPTTPPALLPLLHQDATTRLCHRPLSPPPLRREAGLPLCLAILTLSAATSGHRRRTSAPVDVWGLGLVLYQATKIRHSTFCTARLRPTFTRRPCRAGSFGGPDPHPESEHDDGCPLAWRTSSMRACTKIPTSDPLPSVSPPHSQCSHAPATPPARTHPQMEMVVPHPKPH